MTLRNQNFTRTQLQKNERDHNFIHGVYMSSSGERELKAHSIILAWRLAPDNLLDAMLIAGIGSEEDCAAWIEKLPMSLRTGYCPDTSSWKHHPPTPKVTARPRVQTGQTASGITFNMAVPDGVVRGDWVTSMENAGQALRASLAGTLVTRDRLDGETVPEYITRQRTVRPNTFEEREPAPHEGYADWLERIHELEVRIEDPFGPVE